MRACPLLLLACALAATAPASGEDLHFDEPDQHFEPKGEADDVLASYHFTNRGKKPLTITTVRPTCGCTTTTLDKTTYLPGESGEIMVDFSIGDHSGAQDKTIEVYHDSAPPQVLHLRVDLPAALAIQPNFVSWSRFDPPEPRLVSLSVPPGSPYVLTAAVPSNGLVVAALTPGAPGQWTLRVTPTSTKAAGSVMVELKTSGMRRFYVFASVVDEEHR